MSAEKGICGECGVTGPLDQIQKHFLMEHTEEEETPETETAAPSPSVCSAATGATHGVTTNQVEEDPIWTKTRPSGEDVEATHIFLDLRKQLSSKFDDRKTNKIQCWIEIANQMKEKGYNLGPTPVSKLKQKFANLQKSYYNHIRHIKKTGEEKKEPPPFYDSMDELLGHKDKYKPHHLQDSLVPVAGCSKDTTTNSTSDSETGEEVKNRFKVQNKRPQSVNSKMMELLEKQHQEEREDRDRHFAKFQELMDRQNDQRDRLLDILQQLADKSSK